MRWLLCFFMLTLIGCSNTPATLGTAAATPPLTTLLDEQSFTLPGTEQHVRLQLSTSAHQEQGQVHWDDNQQWRLTLRVNNELFVLHDSPIAIGKLDYWAYTQEGGFFVTTLVAASAQLTITTYQYLPQQQQLRVHHTYRTKGNTNLLRQSPSVF